MGFDRSPIDEAARTFRRRLAITAVLLAAAVTSPPTTSGEEPQGRRWRSAGPARGPVPSEDELLRRGAVIGEIYVQTDNVFDPENPDEDRFLYRLANRLHVTTRPTVIERKLLFREGDPYDPRVLQESARLLRSLDFLYDAWIEPIRYRRNRVDVLVRTRDVWTLGVGAGFERSGGENSLRFSVEESNLFGSGRFVDLKVSDDVDRRSSRFRFVDLGLFGSRAELRLWYADNSDGHRRVFDLARPFFSLDTRWAGAVKVVSDERVERIYHQGNIVQRFHHEHSFAEVRSGFSRGLRDGWAQRWLVGYTYDSDRFRGPGEGGSDGFPLPPSPGDDPLPWPFDPKPYGGGKNGDLTPLDRRLSYVWIGWEQVQDRFIETRNMDQIQRTEDFNLGLELSARLGWSSPAWGGDKNQAIFSADLSSGFTPRHGHIVLVDSHASGRWGSSDGFENTRVGGAVRYFLRNWGQHQLIATVQADAAWNLDPEEQLLLGGDSGLRGYPLRFQDGDRRFLFSVEQRFYTDWELFHLVHVGAAVFFDAGAAWYEDGPLAGRDQGLLKDVGLGLRLSSSRSSDAQMVHLDVAFPLDGDTRAVQWLVTSRNGF